MTETRLAEIEGRAKALGDPGTWASGSSEQVAAVFAILHAREDIPDLIAAVRARDKRITELEATLREIAEADTCWESSTGCRREVQLKRENWCVFCLAADCLGLPLPAEEDIS